MGFREVVRALGSPHWSDDRIALYHVDTLPSLQLLPRGSVPLTVTSPPYNIGKEYEREVPVDKYMEWSAEWIAGVHRATSSEGTFWLNLGYVAVPGKAKAIPIPYLLWSRIPFYLIQEVVWSYGAGVAAEVVPAAVDFRAALH